MSTQSDMHWHIYSHSSVNTVSLVGLSMHPIFARRLIEDQDACRYPSMLILFSLGCCIIEKDQESTQDFIFQH